MRAPLFRPVMIGLAVTLAAGTGPLALGHDPLAHYRALHRHAVLARGAVSCSAFLSVGAVAWLRLPASEAALLGGATAFAAWALKVSEETIEVGDFLAMVDARTRGKPRRYHELPERLSRLCESMGITTEPPTREWLDQVLDRFLITLSESVELPARPIASFENYAFREILAIARQP